MTGVPPGFVLTVLLAAFAVGGAAGALVFSAWHRSPQRPPRPARREPPVGRHRHRPR